MYGLIASPERIWPNLLVDGFYVTSLGVSAMFFLAAQRATGARWSAGLRRIPEAFLSILPVASVLMMALFFGRHVLYSWSRPGAMAGEPAIAGRARYLQPPWVYTRMVIVFAAWMFFAWLFRRISLQQDRHPELALALHHKLTRYAVLFVPVFAFTLTVAAFDWLISADPAVVQHHVCRLRIRGDLCAGHRGGDAGRRHFERARPHARFCKRPPAS